MKTKLQKCYQRVTAIQNDLLHKFTTMIYQTYDTVVIENLDVQAMQMQKKAKNLHRSLFGRFRLYMEYKAIKFKNSRNQGVSRFQSGEELVNSVGK